jgi:hypothetical protein
MPASITRRRLLQNAAVTLGALTAASRTIAAAPCVAPDGDDSSLRKSLHYAESSATPAQKCSGCSFFSDQQGACGKCAIFNGPANPSGHCDSWSARS